jgi:chromosome segregation ATPase
MMDAGNWIAFAGLVLAFVVALLSLLYYLTQQIDQERTWREEADREIAGKLADFKLEAVRTFATAGAIEKSEERLATSLDKVTARLETLASRIEAWGTEIARMAMRKAPPHD